MWIARVQAGEGAQGTCGERAAARGPPMGKPMPRPTVTLRGITFSLMGLRGSVGRGRMSEHDAAGSSVTQLTCHTTAATQEKAARHSPDGDYRFSCSPGECRSLPSSALDLRCDLAPLASSARLLLASADLPASVSRSPPASHSPLR